MSECSVCKTGKYEPWGLGTKYCEKHDICISCGTKRKDLTDIPWGTRSGAFLCKPCEEKERKERIAERKEKGFEHEYTQEIVCPHCGYEQSDSWESGEGEHDCPECGEIFEVERIVTCEYSTSKVEK